MTTNPSLNKQELLAESELLDIAIDVAFRRKILSLLADPDTDPKVLLEFMKMNERRGEQKSKDVTAKLKDREISLDEKTKERRLALDEQKHSLNDQKFQRKVEDREELESTRCAPTPAKPIAPVQRSNRLKALRDF